MIQPPTFTSTTTHPTDTVVPIFKAEDKSLAIDTHRRKSVRRGVSTGWANLDEYMSVKRGAPLFIAGSPHAGKSQFTKALLVNLSKIHGWRHCVYLGEEGEVRDLTLDFVELYVGKPSRMKNDDGTDNEDAMSETEFTSAFLWVNEHFAFVSPDEADVGAFDIATFFSWVKTFEDETGMKFDTTVVDPWNDLAVDLHSKGGREDLFLADALKTVRDSSRINNRVDIVVTHIAAPYSKHVSDKGKRFAAPAEPYEWAGGQTWFRRAFVMLLVYRPPAPDSFRIGKFKAETVFGETWLLVQKAKPRGIGKVGMCRLKYDPKTNMYTEFES